MLTPPTYPPRFLVYCWQDSKPMYTNSATAKAIRNLTENYYSKWWESTPGLLSILNYHRSHINPSRIFQIILRDSSSNHLLLSSRLQSAC